MKIQKGKWYMCVEDYNKCGAKYTKGKLYKCEEKSVLCDDHNSPKTCLENLGLFRRATKEEVQSFKVDERRKRKEILLHSKGIYLV